MSYEPRTITSLQNPIVKFVRGLELRKERRDSGLFAAEGLKVVATARDLGWQPTVLIYEQGNAHAPILRDLIRWGQAAGADCYEASPAILGKLSTRDNPQTVIAVFAQRWSDVLPSAAPWVALEEVRDPGNLGTIIRTADATGAGGIVLIGDCCDPYSREATRASMGSLFNLALARMDRAAFLALASEWQGEIVGTHLTAASIDYRRAYRPGTLLVMGSEGPGLSEELARACTQLVKIPMMGSADSLNLGIATSLMLYEMQRGKLPEV